MWCHLLPQVTSPLELNLLQEKEYFRELKVRQQEGPKGGGGNKGQNIVMWLVMAECRPWAGHL
jgi:hypothetical protein